MMFSTLFLIPVLLVSRSVTAQLANASSTSPAACLNTRFFDQKLNHSDTSSTVTFRQQYQVNTTYFKPGGPILLFIGEESVDMICEESTIFNTWAQELGGISAVIEHRYFGQSLPFGNDSWTRENIVHLTMDNVMMDTVQFAEWIKSNVTGAQDSKVIVGSGSYGGFLATIHRQNHPESIFAALASAGPVRGMGANNTSPERFLWWNYISELYTNQSMAAAGYINASWPALFREFKDNSTAASLKDSLNLCTPPSASDSVAVAVADLLRIVFSLAAEFNYRFSSIGRNIVTSPFDKVIEIALSKKNDSLGLLREANEMWYKPLGFDCFDWEDPSFLQKWVIGIQTIPFSYITCTTLPLLQSVSNSTIFTPLDIADPFGCDELWGVTLPTEEEIQQKLRITQEDIMNSTRIIFAEAQYDPTTAVGPDPAWFLGNTSPDASQYVFMNDTAHREDLFVPMSTDHQGVIQGREIELQILKGWLGIDY